MKRRRGGVKGSSAEVTSSTEALSPTPERRNNLRKLFEIFAPYSANNFKNIQGMHHYTAAWHSTFTCKYFNFTIFFEMKLVIKIYTVATLVAALRRLHDNFVVAVGGRGKEGALTKYYF